MNETLQGSMITNNIVSGLLNKPRAFMSAKVCKSGCGCDETNRFHEGECVFEDCCECNQGELPCTCDCHTEEDFGGCVVCGEKAERMPTHNFKCGPCWRRDNTCKML